MVILQVIDTDFEKITYIKVFPGFEKLVKSLDGQTTDIAEEQLPIYNKEGRLLFDEIGEEVSSPIGATEFYTVWN